MSEVYAFCAYTASAESVTVRLWGTDMPVPVAVPERLVTRKDEKGRAVQYVAVGVA